MTDVRCSARVKSYLSKLCSERHLRWHELLTCRAVGLTPGLMVDATRRPTGPGASARARAPRRGRGPGLRLDPHAGGDGAHRRDGDAGGGLLRPLHEAHAVHAPERAPQLDGAVAHPRPLPVELDRHVARLDREEHRPLLRRRRLPRAPARELRRRSLRRVRGGDQRTPPVCVSADSSSRLNCSALAMPKSTILTRAGNSARALATFPIAFDDFDSSLARRPAPAVNLGLTEARALPDARVAWDLPCPGSWRWSKCSTRTLDGDAA
jgi:hypothetical protein